MTQADRAIASQHASVRLDEPGLEVGASDVLVALLAFAASSAVLAYGMSAIASPPIFVLLHLSVLIIPAAFLRRRVRKGGELTIPLLLLLATFLSGPVGA